MNTRLSSVPSDYASRRELWIRSGLWLSFKEGPFVTLGVKSLGYAERQLLEWEDAKGYMVQADIDADLARKADDLTQKAAADAKRDHDLADAIARGVALALAQRDGTA
jgi:hypothetical protein